jgi:hypothetical protein
MSHQQFHQGAGAASHNNAATTEQPSSLLTANSSPPATITPPPPALPGRQLANTHPCTWPGCPRFFACPHNVQQHIREKHTHEKPYKCEACAADGVDAAFARQYGLNRHRAQVHGIGERPSRVAKRHRANEFAPSAEPAQPVFSPPTAPTEATGADDGFAELMEFLAGTNDEMQVSGGDIEMSDDQFYFDAGQHPGASAATTAPDQHDPQGGGFYGCGDCAYAAATKNAVKMHMHAAHQFPNSHLCACDICQTLFTSSEIDASNQLSLMGQGGFQKIREDTAGFLGEGAKFATASTTTSAWQPDDHTADYTNAGTIDPALLEPFGPSSSVGTSSELPNGSDCWF